MVLSAVPAAVEDGTLRRIGAQMLAPLARRVRPTVRIVVGRWELGWRNDAGKRAIARQWQRSRHPLLPARQASPLVPSSSTLDAARSAHGPDARAGRLGLEGEGMSCGCVCLYVCRCGPVMVGEGQWKIFKHHLCPQRSRETRIVVRSRPRRWSFSALRRNPSALCVAPQSKVRRRSCGYRCSWDRW